MQTMRLVEGYTPPSRLRPGSLGLTLLTTGMFVSGLFFLNPHVVRIISDPIHVIEIAPPPPPPPPEKQVEHHQVPPKETLYVPPTHPDVVMPKAPDLDFVKTPPVEITAGEGIGAGAVIPEPAKQPVLTGADIDPRYASYFQPTYPPDEIRESRTGRVTVRVLIGTDGRVKDIEKVSAPSEPFWESTRRQALSKWRFKPATRDGVPYETWKTMNVSFVLNQEQ
jgi:protein TonB